MLRWRDRTAGYLGAVIGLILVCGALALLAQSLGPAPQTSEKSAPVASGSAVSTSDAPKTIGDSPGAATVRVFQCTRGGQPVFSDHSCGANARVQEIDLSRLNTYAPVVMESSSAEPRSVRPETRESVVEPGRASTAECEALQDEKDRIDARMRIGYRSAEGERLRKRWHEVDDRYRDLHCLRRQ